LPGVLAKRDKGEESMLIGEIASLLPKGEWKSKRECVWQCV
jgi:hypothetical protein